MQIRFVSTDPAVMGGTPVFAGTRVPVSTLIEYLEAGGSIDDFLEGYPGVERAHVVAVLEAAFAELIRQPLGP